MTDKMKLLLVDDEVDFAESLADLLDFQGYEVHLAHNGQDALSKFSEQAFDMVILDMKMPGMNGVECLRAIRDLKPGTMAVMLTAFTHMDFINQALDAGALCVLNKTMSTEELLTTLQSFKPDGPVLLVDDDKEFADEVRGILESRGFSVHCMHSLAEAEEALNTGQFHVMILDYFLPDGTGRELLDRLYAKGDDQKTILITGYPEKMVPDMPYLSPEDILIKPFPPEKLLEAIEAKRMRNAHVEAEQMAPTPA